ncbi:receptor-type tyrosine-protein phosphatase alpha-like [Pecten maximus]|uniref:receptor-type tyrosine-protein phosphatase alpha-like n=1 Tax=Pecten maximus TaxID=6579 RepID=UPI00145825DA|nr:receptor-type tyrosine-protein phosphatase alpha-like [Pecten maximus]
MALLLVCDSGKFGQHCTNTCGSCLNGAACHHINGTCLTGCDPGKKGDDCKTDCSPGEYGPNCENKCGNCEHGTLACNRTDGSCPDGCLVGWQAPLCKNVCQHGWYGQNCAERCGKCRNGHTCNNTIGTCEDGCSPGWKESLCKQECSARWYGNACQEKCGYCAGGRNCHHVHGTCFKDGESHRCDPGMKGMKCKTDCSNTEYGPDCSQVCGRCFNSSCESVSGNCTEGCLDGWTGVQCVEELIASELTISLAVIGTSIVLAILPLVVLVFVIKMRRRHHELNYSRNQEIGVQYENTAVDIHIDSDPNLISQRTYEDTAAGTHLHTEPNLISQRTYENMAAGTHMYTELENMVTDTHMYTEPTQKKQRPYGTLEEDTHMYTELETMTADTHIYTEPIHTKLMKNEMVGNVTREQEPQSGTMAENLILEITRKEESNEFEKDLKEILTDSQFTCEEATKAENKSRNRNKTTLPYDHSRVQLEGNRSYSNASYIKDLRETNTYVATQGPKTNTIGDFWEMVWQLETGRIVTLTQGIEQENPTVEKYWPDFGSSIEHGSLKIRFISSKTYAAYTVRELRLENVNSDEKRVISQFHFTKWPDHGTPDVMHFALLLLHVNSISSKFSGPMVVHCSAGVGRTGTFIALDVLFQNGKLTGRVDPLAYIKSMGMDRTGMVQTKSQYVFIYRVLVELFLIDNTYLEIGDFSSKCLNSSRLLREYKRLTGNRPTIPIYQNTGKNRDPELLPGPAKKKDYINAVILPSVHNYEGYIVTQWPLPDTAGDFWAMIYDYKSTAVVILDSDADDPDLIPSQEDSEVTAGNFSVHTLSSPRTVGSISVSEVYLTKARDDNSYQIKIFRMCDWPQDKQTCVEGCMKQMVNASQECQRNTVTHGPITVVCRNGSSICGIFCTVANAIENINLNQRTSLIQVVRQLQLRCPSFIGTYESYVICNREVKSHFASLSK